MTFAPTKKKSKSQTKERTSAWIKRTALKLENTTSLNKEWNGLSHFADIEWKYKGRQVVAVKTKSKKVTRI